MNKNTLTRDVVIQRAINIHGNKYDYSKLVYTSMHSDICIICPIHGEFFQKANIHINRKCGCPKCGGHTNTEIFIKKALKIHGNKYDYSKVDYIKDTIDVKIICDVHGEFLQKPKNHLQKNGCPKCSESHGEKIIRTWLESKNIKYTYQKRFDECKNKYPLPFDFYLPDYNLCIEYDGQQHFEESSYFGKDSFIKTKKHDKLKNAFCKEFNISLLRIKYDENILEILNKNIK